MTIIPFLALVVGHLFILVNIKFTAWPEMLAYPYLISHGFLPYRDIVFPYFPLLPNLLTVLYNFFGQSVSVLQFFTWITILIVDGLVFYLTFLVFGKKSLALMGMAGFILWQPYFDGNMMWFDLALSPLILIGAILQLQFNKKRLGVFLFLAGVCWGLAVTVKQQAVVFYLASVLFLLTDVDKKIRHLLLLLAGFSLPILLTLASLASVNILDKFANWAIIVPIFVMSRIGGYASFPSIEQVVTLVIFLIPAWLLLARIVYFSKTNRAIFLLLLLFLASLTNSLPRFSLFRFQAVIILVAPLFVWWVDKYYASHKKIVPGLLIIVLGISLWSQQWFYRFNWGQSIRFFEEETLVGSQYLSAHTTKEEQIYLLNVSSVWYVLSNRLPPKPWVDNFPWYFEVPGVQDEVIASFARSKPKVVLYRYPSAGPSYQLGTYQPDKLIRYLMEYYSQKQEIAPGVWWWEAKK